MTSEKNNGVLAKRGQSGSAKKRVKHGRGRKPYFHELESRFIVRVVEQFGLGDKDIQDMAALEKEFVEVT